MKLTSLQVQLIRKVRAGNSFLGYGDKIVARALAKRGLLDVRYSIETIYNPHCTPYPLRVGRAYVNSATPLV